MAADGGRATKIVTVLDELEATSGRDLRAWSALWLETAGVDRLGIEKTGDGLVLTAVGALGIASPDQMKESDAPLAAALDRLAGDPAERTRLGAAGREWALQTRTWEANARRYRALYDRLGVHPR